MDKELAYILILTPAQIADEDGKNVVFPSSWQLVENQ